MNYTLLNTIRSARGFSRTVTYLVIVAVVGVVLERVVYYTLHKAEIIEAENTIEKLYRIAPHKARQLGLPKQVSQQAKEKTNDTKLSEAVIETQDTLDVLAYELHRDGGDSGKAQDKLNNLYAQLRAHDQQAMTDFTKIGKHIQDRQLPDVIKERHDKAVYTYRQEMDIFLGRLKIANETQDPKERLAAVMAARQHLEGKQLKRSHQPFDPDNLPHKSLKPGKDSKPKLKEEQFIQAGLHNTPYAQYAALGDFTYGNLAGASNPAYLAETMEVKLTQAIRDQAQALNFDPVQIYYWVRNNIEWLPTWGAMQDADITLGSKRGNAMDIATLHIALLRASQIPARYAHGTIIVPAEQFMNWVGPFTDIDAAATFAASAGVPLVAQVAAGEIKAIRMEHIWVETAIDYHPSRGTINRDADSWLALDGSYKQYENLTGLDVAAIANLDGQALADSFAASGTVNEAEGWSSGLDPTILQTAQTEMQTALDNYITTNLPNATVVDVIGGRKIIVQQASSLPSSLPNEVLVTGARYSEFPAVLQAQLSLALGKDLFGQPIGEVTLPWARINNHKLTLSFKPATPEDEAVLQSYLPAGDITDISQLPSSLPAYLINVIPEIKLNGQVVTQGQSMTLGQEIDFIFGLRMPGINLGTYDSPVQAGSYVALAMFAGSVSSQRLNELQTKIINTKTILESNDPAMIDTLSRDDLMGDIFQVGVLGYYSQSLSSSYVAGLKQHVSQQLLPSGGTYGYVPKVSYFFGLPRAIEPGGIQMDLDSISTVTTAWDGDVKKRFNMIQLTGMLSSALEHAVPEQMFISPNQPGEGVSAVKLLSKANSAGQKIYHITQANRATTLSNLNLDAGVMGDIYAGLNAGKEVIAHTDNLTVNGYTGAGYIIFDPEVGDGAYMIGGGLNGGVLAGLLVLGLFGFLTALFLFALTTLLSVVLGAILLSLSALLLKYVYDQGYGSAVSAGLSLATAIFVLVVAPPLVIAVALIEIALLTVAFIISLMLMIISLRPSENNMKRRYV